MQSVSIIYLPGYGGNFLRSIFSLDPCTVPCVNQLLEQDTPHIRAELYTSSKKISMQHLGDIISRNQSTVLDVKQHTMIVDAIHPHEFFETHSSPGTQIFLVNLNWSRFSNYWLMKNKIDFDYQHARLRPDEILKYLKLYRRSDVLHIDLNVMLDKARWKEEYQRINSVMNLPDHLAAAQLVYDFWYDLRVAKQLQEYSSLTQADHAFFCRERLKEEIWGTPSQWRIFYERVRDPTWPDCENETDFYNLPESIQEELITVFNYQPPKPI